MRNSIQSFSSTAAQIIIAISAVIALLQYIESVNQSKTNAALSFIAIHNNERFYDARKALLEAELAVETQAKTRHKEIGFDLKDLEGSLLKEIKRDIALSTATKDNEKIQEKTLELDISALSLIYLYDSAAECVQAGACRYDITDQHFLTFMKLILESYKSKIEEWKKELNDGNLSNKSKMFRDREIKERNFIQQALSVIGLPF